jgi:dihydroorotate dehydrogenase (fumarate)
MDLTTTYMGLTLRSPLVVSASPLSENIDNIKRMENAGAAAVVLHSLFEEQLCPERYDLHYHLMHNAERFPETLSHLSEPENIRVEPEEYLNHISQAKEKVRIPIVASLNGSSVGEWTDYARQIEQAGADALELNVYSVPTDMELTAEQIEQAYIDVLKAVKAAVTIPVAVKLSPYFTNMANMAKRLDRAGADALVLFNRFYQPDINLETRQVEAKILLSTSESMHLPLRWIAILYGRLHANLAATSGIHTGLDVLKLLMAGADITMLASVLLRHGIDRIRAIEQEMRAWMKKHEYESIQQMQGRLSQNNYSNPSAFERAQYVRVLRTYKPESARVYEPSHYFG